VDLYRDAAARAGHDPVTLPISINSHGFIADDATEAAELAFPPFAETMTRIGRERGWPPTTRAHFDAEAELHGALFVGSPQEVVEKILYQWEIFRHDRFLLQLTVGPMAHDRVLRAIELLGTEVAPVVRRELGQPAAKQ
jgi:alkanesulfonate monooxygenase SsuD/methylene tetrahydromethanopterin reductase-like flavin-dependent oxidoreductase (luciferase family)